VPFAVSNWPYSPDPRSSAFSAYGYAFGSVAPWQWIVSSHGASGAWEFLNAGVLTRSIFDDFATTVWSKVPESPVVAFVELRKEATQEIVGSPPRTVHYQVNIEPSPFDPFGTADLFLEWPVANRAWTGLELQNGGIPIPEVPNGIDLTPALWSLESP